MGEENKLKIVPQIGPREVIYEDKVRQIHKVTADFGPFEKEYFVIESGHRAGLVATKGESVLLVRQYRLLIGGLSWEIPGGRVDQGETPEAAAVRECMEETGVLCKNLKPLIDYQPGLDSLHNPTHLFYSHDAVSETDQEPDPREVVEHQWVPLSRCIEMVFGNQIVDSFSIVGILSYKALMGDK